MKIQSGGKLALLSLALSGLLIQPALAGNERHFNHANGHQKQGQNTFAKVVGVVPVTETIAQQTPQQSCWIEQVRYSDPHQNQQSYTPAIIGGLVGIAIGSSLGQKHHKTNRAVKAVALGTLGASIGNDIGRKNAPAASYSYRDEERCATRYETRYQEQIIGYDVTYRYQGETYQTRMDYDPGDRIRVRVQIRPII